jgi:hypothetical protein
MIREVKKFIEEYLFDSHFGKDTVDISAYGIVDWRPKITDPKIIDLLIQVGQENPTSRVLQYCITPEETNLEGIEYLRGRDIRGHQWISIRKEYWDANPDIHSRYKLDEEEQITKSTRIQYRYYLSVLFEDLEQEYDFKNCQTNADRLIVAERAIIGLLSKYPEYDLSDIIKYFGGSYEEDIRYAFWNLVGAGTISLANREFKPVLVDNKK